MTIEEAQGLTDMMERVNAEEKIRIISKAKQSCLIICDWDGYIIDKDCNWYDLTAEECTEENMHTYIRNYYENVLRMHTEPQYTAKKPDMIKTFDCDCYYHKVEFYHDTEDRLTYINFWYGGVEEDSLWDRIKMAFNVLCRGKSLLIDIVLRNQEIKKMNDYLKGVVSYAEEHEAKV